MKDSDVSLLLLLILLTATRSEKDRADGVLSRVASRATEAMVDVVDPDVIMEHVDVNSLLERVDVNAVVSRVDVDALLDEVDVNQLLARVDINDLLARVDVDALIERVDVNAIMSRVDVEAIVDRVDVKDITDRAGIPEIVQESTGALAGSALDVFRRQIVAIDKIVSQAAYRLIRRDPETRPAAPPDLETGWEVGEKGRGLVTGHYSGPLSRLLAFMADALIVWFSFVLFATGIFFVLELFFAVDRAESSGLGLTGLLLLILWAFFYMWFSLSIGGRTFGMALLGLRVLDRQGQTLTGGQALKRTLVFPFSFLLFGLGFIGIFVSPTRRTLHDAAAGSVVVYDWGDRPAEMPAPLTKWVARHEGDDDGEDDGDDEPKAS